jgi:hypothetical protein
MSADHALQLVGIPGAAEVLPRVVFCSHCGKPPEGGAAPEVGTRVCQRCNLGLLLDAPPALAPKDRDAFVVVDRTLAIQALSKRSEKLLGLRELDAIDKRITELLVPADAESDPTRPHALSALLVEAASSATDEVTEAIVRPADEFGVRFAARIGPCGPTPGALVVLDMG